MRKLSGFWRYTVLILSVSLVLFQIITTGFGVLQDLKQRTIHMAFVLFLLFILKPATKKLPKDQGVPLYDVILAIISVVCCMYIFINADRLIWDTLIWYSPFHKILSVIIVLLVLEASRRSIGWAFPIMAVILFFYTFQGELFPGVWRHRNFRFDVVFQTLYNTTNGVWGQMIGLSSVMLAMFSIFGAVLGITGGSNTFISIGQKLFGKSVGGQGKVALIASGLFGMISGSALGNVVATGTFTIPMMKKAKYTNEWAAAIAAVGAAGGAIMPPMMGAGAFIMAQFLSIPYLKIAIAAAVPAVLYYLGSFVAVHYFSKKRGIKGHEEKTKIELKEYLVIFVPILIFLIFLSLGYAVQNAAFYASFAGLISYIILFILLEANGENAKDASSPEAVISESKKTEKKNKWKMLAKLGIDVSESSTQAIVDMVGLLGGAQILITLISLTGLAVKLSDLIVSIGGQSLFLTLFLSMVVCIILGMGLPITASYVLGASILAPALIILKLNPLVAHLFVFYFCCFSVLTPPVCGAVFLASGIAESNWFKTGLLACLIALPGFIVPYAFTYNQGLLLSGSLTNIIITVITALIGVFSTGIGVAGYTNRNRNMISRAIFFIAGIMLILPDYKLSAIGLVILILNLIDFSKLRTPKVIKK
jgi:TRAP transporter 4TM/12TM fusion protein